MGVGNGSKRKISPKIRHEAINLVLEENMSMQDAAKKKGIGKSTLSKFIADFKRNGNKIVMSDDDSKESSNSDQSTPKQSELQELRNKVRKLKAEKEVLKKTISILMSDE